MLRRRGAAGDRGRTRSATQIKAAGGNVLVLEAGDVFQGSLFFTTYSGQAEAEMMNKIGLDAMVYGNHEFDLGSEPLGEVHRDRDLPGAVRQRRCLRRQTPRAAWPRTGWCSRSAARRSAILGATTTDTPEIASPDKADVFRDPVAYLTGEVEALEAEGVDKIILLSPPRGERRRRGRRRGAGDRRDRRRPQPHALLQHRSERRPTGIR